MLHTVLLLHGACQLIGGDRFTCGAMRAVFRDRTCCDDGRRTVASLSRDLLAAGACTCADVRERYRCAACTGNPNATVPPNVQGLEALPDGCGRHDAGGTLYIAQKDNMSAWKEVRSLSDVAYEADAVVGQTPHMVLPSPAVGSYAAGEWVAITNTNGDVVYILQAATREMVGWFKTTGLAGSKLHTAWWHVIDDVLYLVLVDMTGEIDGQPGGGLHLLRVDFGGQLYYVSSWSAAQATAVFGATKPIAVGGPAEGDVLFVTDAKMSDDGYAKGYFVRVSATAITFMSGFKLAAPCAGGGLWVEPDPHNATRAYAMYGTQTSTSCVVHFELGTSSPTFVRGISLHPDSTDAHGLAFCGTDLLLTSRVSATLDVVPAGATSPSEHYDLNALASSAGAFNDVDNGCGTAQGMQPDVAQYDNATSTLYVVTRGRRPYSAVKSEFWRADAAPGLFAFEMEDCRPTGAVRALGMDATRTGTGAPDGHGMRVVGDEVWAIDQAPTGQTAHCGDAHRVYVAHQPRVACSVTATEGGDTGESSEMMGR